MWRSQKVASKWNGWLRDSLRVCGRSVVWQGDADDDSRRWLHWEGVVWVCRKSKKGGDKGSRESVRETREVVMGRKWKVEVCPSPEVIYTSDPRPKAHSVANALLWQKAYALFMFLTPSWWGCALEGWRNGGTEGLGGVGVYGAVEEWLPGVELRDESRERVFYFVNWSVQMEMSEQPEN